MNASATQLACKGDQVFAKFKGWIPGKIIFLLAARAGQTYI